MTRNPAVKKSLLCVKTTKTVRGWLRWHIKGFKEVFGAVTHAVESTAARACCSACCSLTVFSLVPTFPPMKENIQTDSTKVKNVISLLSEKAQASWLLLTSASTSATAQSVSVAPSGI